MGKSKAGAYFIFQLLAVLFFTGCGRETPGIQNPSENISPEAEDLKNSSVPTLQEGGEEQDPDSGGMQEEQSQGVSQKLTQEETAVWKPEEHIVILKDGKAWGELPVVGEEDAVYCNLPENVNGYGVRDEQKLVLVCPEPLSGITYYVDYGRDYYIHAIQDGVEELAVEIPAKNLYCRGGKLYFMVEDYGRYILDGLENGDVLSYNPADGKISTVINGIGSGTSMPVTEIYKEEGRNKGIAVPDETRVSETYMAVYQDGIYYCRRGERIPSGEDSYLQPEVKYHYFFDTGESEQLEETRPWQYTFRRRGEGLLCRNWNEAGGTWSWSLKSPLKGQEQFLKPLWNVLYLVGDKAYTVMSTEEEEGSELAVYDILTEEEIRCPLDTKEDAYIGAMFVFEDSMYFADLYSYSFAEGKGHYAYSDIKELKKSIGEYLVMEYYTDGEQLYAVSMLDGKIYRLRRQDDSVVLDIIIKIITYDYKFEFLPMGE